MYQVEIYGRIRRAVLVEGRSQRSVAREFGLARVTVRKMLGYSIPPGYRRKEPVQRPKLGPLGIWPRMSRAAAAERAEATAGAKARCPIISKLSRVLRALALDWAISPRNSPGFLRWRLCSFAVIEPPNHGQA
jgi:ribosomal protein S14